MNLIWVSHVMFDPRGFTHTKNVTDASMHCSMLSLHRLHSLFVF